MGVFREYIRPYSSFVFFRVAKIYVEFQSGIWKKIQKSQKWIFMPDVRKYFFVLKIIFSYNLGPNMFFDQK